MLISNGAVLQGVPDTPAERATAPSQRNEGFFRYHGVWAPGVRLFRALQFKAKAAIVSAVFVVPVLLLASGLWSTTQSAVDFTAKERQGVVAMRGLMPVLEGVLKVRFATRSIFGGFDASADQLAAWSSTRDAIGRLRQQLEVQKDPIGLLADVRNLESQWQATEHAFAAKDDKGLSVFAPVTKTLVAVLTKLGDDSNLVLDPDVDSFYLINAMVLDLPQAAEDVARIWGWSTYATAKGGLETKDARNYLVWASEGSAKLREARSHLTRAISANPALKSKIDLEPIDTALAFIERSTAAVDASKGDARQLYRDGLAATSNLFKVYSTGLDSVDGLLADRVEAANSSRTLRFIIVTVCLLAAAYLFKSFYIVTEGGMNEVKRHLAAMTAGDLTTAPSPWGNDEAATLMHALKDMQASLRLIVQRVRGSSDSIVHASSEIASASLDLSARTEQTASNLEETASSMEEISSTVQNTSASVREAASLATSNADAAARGGVVIGQVVTTMKEINASSGRIGEIIGTIDSIAFRTNILALNAAVEAARAGEQGRGFAVVASEVRSLAQRSAVAAREIKELIGASVDSVGAGTKIVESAGQTMQEIVANAGRMKGLLAEISTAASEQSSGITQVGAAVQDLDRMTQQNAALVEESAAAAAALKDQAISMSGEVSKFRLPTA